MSLDLDSWAIQEEIWAPRISLPAIKLALGHLESGFRFNHNVLEIGSGNGQIAEFIAEQGAKVVGIDVNPHSLQYAHSRYSKTHYIQANAEVLPFDKASFDSIFCYSSLQYTDRDKVLSECARVLNDNGRFAIVENLIGNPVAKGFRFWNRLSNQSYSPYQCPRQHLRWSERQIYERYFSEVNYQVLYLASPLMLLLKSIRNNPKIVSESNWEHRLFSFINKLDKTILQMASFPKHFAWIAVINGKK